MIDFYFSAADDNFVEVVDAIFKLRPTAEVIPNPTPATDSEEFVTELTEEEITYIRLTT